MSLKILLFSRRKWDSAELELDRVWIGREEEGGCPESVPGLCHQFLVITKFNDYAEPSLTHRPLSASTVVGAEMQRGRVDLAVLWERRVHSVSAGELALMTVLSPVPICSGILLPFIS